ncbi:master DNA invertase Mpi family serine-type recombinase [Pseudobacteriovorax antillogorgiicola]|uniref:Site-specific DNA recombinase n=1 Tax=Pseudobacteriovorax antillogorgiicola TaxID=1513793 RepID=A0A1Y6CWP5_9BACT|nr:master DNA invertase Mpi family serine-type recombinase [Pseudobacteriovorax antillogorgiicola]TCS44208.1 DNA invertase Pin-like site-specific DNA recombinase [Pseudobacteriovorax antillogorgiicola]SMF80408.1 Site-specific DNA recombinase [Pseudobacteriovorax antillogorgiicola]
MICAYIRISSDKQSVENQRFEILRFADERKLTIDQWVEEAVSGSTPSSERELGELIDSLKKGDSLIATELSRFGRSLYEVMAILNILMKKDIRVLTTKEGYELGDNINSKVLAFAFGISGEIERNMISMRTKEALARKKSEGKKLGRPKGRLSKVVKLSGKENEIRTLLQKKVPIASIAKIFEVHRRTVHNFIKTRGIG